MTAERSVRDWPLHVRRARATDRAAVMDFATTTWNGWDYIPHAWASWLGASDGVLLVATAGVGETPPTDAEGNALAADWPIAVARVALLSADEAWLEGIRVDPRVRGLGIATDLQVAELQWAAASGVRVVRYATGERNEASHRLGARHGFTLRQALRNWHSHSAAAPFDDDHDDEGDETSGFDEEARAAANALRGRLLVALAADGLICDAAGADDAWARLQSDPTFRALGGLFEKRGWTMQQLTRPIFDAHVGRGEVVVSTDDGWAMVMLHRQAPPAEDVDVHLGVVAGDGAAALRLADRLHRQAGSRIRFWLPDPDPPLLRGLADDFSAARFHGRPWTLHILERPLDDGHPLPAPDRPASLVLEDEPVALSPPAE